MDEGDSVNKAFKYRIYPDHGQRELITKTFGCVRFVYNRMLADKNAYYEEHGTTLKVTPGPYKSDYPWLKEVDSLALCNAQLQLQTAFKSFFEREEVGYPTFRSKKCSRQSYTTNLVNGNIRIYEKTIRLPKLGEVHIKLHRQIPKDYKIKSVTVSYESTGKYYVSILTEYEAETDDKELGCCKSLGLDYSSPHFYVDSNGVAADMPHFFREAEERLAREDRKLSRMKKYSKNYEKQKKRVALAKEKVKNARKDWQHKLSRQLADEYDVICVEDIDLKALSQTLNLGKSTYDNGFGQFRRFLDYKLREQGKKLITIDKWYPSSRLCGQCGYKNTELTLSDREWECPECGAHLDRDQNAAENIRKEGLRQLA